MIRKWWLSILLLFFGFSSAYGGELRFKISSLKPYQGEIVSVSLFKTPKAKKDGNKKVRKVYTSDFTFKVVIFEKEYLAVDREKEIVVSFKINRQQKPGKYLLAIILERKGRVHPRPIMKILKVRSRQKTQTKDFLIDKTVIEQADILIVQRAVGPEKPFAVNFSGHTYHSYDIEGKEVLYLGIHYQIKPGKYTLKVFDEKTENVFKIRVVEKFKSKKYITPERPPEIQKKVNEQMQKFQQLFKKFTAKPFFNKPFVWPLKKIIVTDGGKFGNDRCSNGKILSKNCRYHTGTDFRGAFDEKRRKLEKVFAINDGKVAEADNYLTMGKTIVINHGRGIFSGYLHLSKFLVKKGDTVKRGQTIGIAGNTGTDSVHLHLFIHINNGRTVVDPYKFLKLSVQ